MDNKTDVKHDESTSPSPNRKVEEPSLESGGHVEDKQRSRRLVRAMDLRILPLCAWIYLLNYLDRGNIGNGKVLNEETGDDLLQNTGMNDAKYAIAVSLFSLAYFLFEVPSNWIMKRYVRPSLWLGTLLLCWGLLTIWVCGRTELCYCCCFEILNWGI
jgi:hypothetical protein